MKRGKDESISPSIDPTSPYRVLIRHKIVFETIFVVVLSGAAIFVSILQWRTAETQADIARRQSEPNFVISTHLFRAADDTSFTDEELHVQNFGGAAREPNLTVAVWCDVTATKTDSVALVKTRIPVGSYFPAQFVTSNSVAGLIIRGKGTGNNKTAMEVEQRVRDQSTSHGYRSCILDFRRYVRLSYYDLFDKAHTKYFYVRPVSGGQRISEQEGRERVDDFSMRFAERGGVELYNLDAEKIFERLNGAGAPH